MGMNMQATVGSSARQRAKLNAVIIEGSTKGFIKIAILLRESTTKKRRKRRKIRKILRALRFFVVDFHSFRGR
jgi:hypothetical protein